MIVGVLKEIKNQEYRVGLTPAGARELTHLGHDVLVQSNAGKAIGFDDALYEDAGASIAASADEIFEKSTLIVKVKEPQPEECKKLKPHHTLFAYLHLAPDAQQTQALIASGAFCIAYETVTAADGTLPLLAPMSEVAGRMAVQAAAHCLEISQGGRGILMGGVPGVSPAHVTVIGGGTVGINAARMALGLGANVTILDRHIPRIREIESVYGGRITTLFSDSTHLAQELERADAVIGAVLIPGASAPKLVTRAMLKTMKAGAVLVDVAIDQGGCFETSKATTHDNPTYVVDGITHYCVSNIPGAVARTATLALTNATMPFVIELAQHGVKHALARNSHLRNGLNIANGKVTCDAVAQSQNLAHTPAETFLDD